MSSYDVRVRSASASFAIPSVVVLRNYEKRGAEKAPKFSKRLMMLRDGYRCQYCKDSFPPSLLTCDHVVPRAYGGSSTWENTVCACTACNAKKASLLPSQLKAVGMRLPNPRAPSAYELEAAARGLAVHNLLRKKNSTSVWKSTSELGYEPPRHRADAAAETTSPRWRGIATPSRTRRRKAGRVGA